MDTNHVLLDEPLRTPLNNYDKIAEVLAEIITESKPQFTVGIYGEWGTGKTTLMKTISKKISDCDRSTKVIPVWFNAWRYEREEHFAAIALMKTIAYGIDDCEKFKKVGKAIMSGSLSFAKGMVDKWFFEYIAGTNFNKIKNKVWEKTRHLDSIERTTIYFDGLSEITKEMEAIRDKDEKYRIVVFIDDLDRCSPPKALEVLESIKAFLNICGFIYVLGISHETTSKLIDQAYNQFGVEGKEYIKKIIQVPITLPPWKNGIEELFSTITENLNIGVSKSDTRDKIFKISKHNPRQLKRIMNSFIIAKNTYSNNDEELNVDTLFTSLYIQFYRPKFFSKCRHDSTFRKVVSGFFAAWDGLKRPSLSGGSIELKFYELELHKLNFLITSKHAEKPNDKEVRDILNGAFWHYTRSKESSEAATETSSADYMHAHHNFHKIIDSGEFTEMNESDWQTLRNDFNQINDSLKLDMYVNAIDMMKEDLKIEKMSEV